MNWLKLFLIAVWEGIKSFWTVKQKRQADVNSGAADALSAVATENKKAEERAKAKSDEVDSDPNLRDRAERLFGRKAKWNAGGSAGSGSGNSGAGSGGSS